MEINDTEETAYEWQDINIHGGIGDRIIDLSNTVLPEDTAVISIRHLVGNIVIYVPYEVEIMIHHSAIFGRSYILNEYIHNLMNQIISYKTKNYDTTYPRVKIITSISVREYRGETYMMTIIRHVLTSIAFGILLTVTVISITFVVFPLTDWKTLFSNEGI